ncbi:MAG: hypothetical protein V1664_04260 [Candidatus Uhrbacteria bacterium]
MLFLTLFYKVILVLGQSTSAQHYAGGNMPNPSYYQQQLGFLKKVADKLAEDTARLIQQVAVAENSVDSSADRQLLELTNLLAAVELIRDPVPPMSQTISNIREEIIKAITTVWLVICDPETKEVYCLEKDRSHGFQPLKGATVRFQQTEISCFEPSFKAGGGSQIVAGVVAMSFKRSWVFLSLGHTSSLKLDDGPKIYFGLFVDQATADSFTYQAAEPEK